MVGPTECLGVLLNPPWGSVKPKELEGLALPDICKHGFVFVWVDKEVLDEVVDVLVRQKYVYVENLTWVTMAPNNRVRSSGAGACLGAPFAEVLALLRRRCCTAARRSSGARTARCSSSGATSASSPKARRLSCGTSVARMSKCRSRTQQQARSARLHCFCYCSR